MEAFGQGWDGTASQHQDRSILNQAGLQEVKWDFVNVVLKNAEH